MERWYIFRKLIERGSDEFAKALYDRLCADRILKGFSDDARLRFFLAVGLGVLQPISNTLRWG